MSTLAARASRVSRTVMTQLVFPEHANALGKAFGGQVMAWIDMCGGVCSMRHTGSTTVTAAIDDVHFERPIAVGDVAVIEAGVTATFNTSLEVEVVVHGESPRTGERWRCVGARLTFVAIDAQGRPAPVPALAVESLEEEIRETEAHARRRARLDRRRGSPVG